MEARVLAAIDPVAAAHGATPEAVALARLRRQPGVTSVILGVKHVGQMEANLKATELPLPSEEVGALSGASALPAEYPGRMLAQGNAPREVLLATGTVEQEH